MEWISKIVGIVGSIGGLLYGVFLLFVLQYFDGPPATDVLNTFIFMFFVPVVVALYASWTGKSRLLFLSVIWCLPLCLYLLATPGLVKLMIASPLLLLTAGILMFWVDRPAVNEG